MECLRTVRQKEAKIPSKNQNQKLVTQDYRFCLLMHYTVFSLQTRFSAFQSTRLMNIYEFITSFQFLTRIQKKIGYFRVVDQATFLKDVCFKSGNQKATFIVSLHQSFLFHKWRGRHHFTLTAALAGLEVLGPLQHTQSTPNCACPCGQWGHTRAGVPQWQQDCFWD